MNRQQVLRKLSANAGKHYVYLLKEGDGTPFYVGLGQGDRIFSHEDEARDPGNISAKCRRIREVLAKGDNVKYEIDSFHVESPWHREEELIRTLSQHSPLTNSQRYAPASEVDGIVLRKYANAYSTGENVLKIPSDFPYRETRLTCGPHSPGPRAKVYGRICAVLREHSGITGELLISKLHEIDWSDVRSAYTEGRSRVCGKWLADYIKGGFYKKNQFIRVFEDQE